jgi:GNAT superfamily N-acetyltransferase
MITELLAELEMEGTPVCRYEIHAKAVEITVLWVPKHLRGQGYGSRLLLETITEIRDITSLPITLSAMPFDGGKMIDLIMFYTAHGFTMSYQGSDACEMYLN